MSVLEIEDKLQRMNKKELEIVVKIAAQLIRNKKSKNSIAAKRAKLKTSAEIMLSEYENNANLTVLTILDKEDFIDA